jgi:hypothetical protein
MIDALSWVITINVIVICITLWKCVHMKYEYLYDELQAAREQFNIQNLVPEDD